MFVKHVQRYHKHNALHAVMAACPRVLTLTLALLVGWSPGFSQPTSVEIGLYRISDTSGLAHSDNPGVALPFFETGEITRLTFLITVTGDAFPSRTFLDLAPAANHGSPTLATSSFGEVLDPGANYLSFDWTIPSDAVWSRFDLIASVRDPGGTVIYDDTESGPTTVGLSEAAWLYAFTVGAFGTTVISHGFSASGWEGGPRPWMLDLAQEIAAVAGRADILEYDAATGLFVPVSIPKAAAPGDGEQVLLFNWAEDSGMLYEGFSESASDALFVSLLLGERNGDLDIENLHLIGHSRGTVINSEVAQRLSALGREVAHITHLDAHDWGVLGGVAGDYDVNPGLNIAFPSGTTPNAGTVAWQGADFIDVYYQQNVAFLDPVPDPPRPACAEFRFLPELNGRPVLGAYNEDWTCRPNPGSTATNVTHSGMHEAYRETVSSGEQTGFFYSRLGGGTALRPEDDSANRENNTFSFEAEGIVNGDFERGTIPTDVSGSEPRPGWSIHGGGGIGGSITGPFLQLSAGQFWREHNRFLIPVSANNIHYALRIELPSAGTPGSTDKLAVYLSVVDGPSILVDEVWLNEVQDWTGHLVDVRPYRDEIVTLRFEIEPASGIDSEVWIDNVSFTPLATSIAADLEVFLEGPYMGGNLMGTHLGTVIPESQPFTGVPWDYPGVETVYPGFFADHPEIVDWVYLQLRSDTSTVVAEAAGLLKDDGHVVSHTDGTSPVEVNVPPGSYYVVLDHRNHIAAMSDAPADLTGAVGAFDFTEAGVAFGANPMADLSGGAGPFGLWAGDANADGDVQALDFDSFIAQTTAGASGYETADFNLDGVVQALDFNLYIANTLDGASSQVP